MVIFDVDCKGGKVQIAAENSQVAVVAAILNSSSNVDSFYVQGNNSVSQPMTFGVSAGCFKKWISPIQQ